MKIVVIGASSGIGRAVAVECAQRGHTVGVSARRVDALKQLQHDRVAAVIRAMDVRDPKHARTILDDMIAELGGMDVIVLSSGVGFENAQLAWEKDEETIEVNVLGFAALATKAGEYFLRQGSGCIAGISSIAALRGGESTAAYSASKAFESNYMDGLRRTLRKQNRNIRVLEIQPGFVDTPLAQGDNLFWVAPVEKAARQIVDAIEKGRNHVYVSRRWRLIAWLLKLLPR